MGRCRADKELEVGTLTAEKKYARKAAPSGWARGTWQKKIRAKGDRGDERLEGTGTSNYTKASHTRKANSSDAMRKEV